MEFNRLNVKNNNFDKPEWQDCDTIHISCCTPDTAGTSYNNKNYHYHKVDVVDENGNIIKAQFVNSTPDGISPGEHGVKVQVKLFNGKKSFTFKASDTGSNSSNTNTSKNQTANTKTPEELTRIARGNACNAASRVANDPATFWGMVDQIYKYIETGELPI
jgi:hypothetical protein